jgi:uncharacterized protein YdhG (YjbR/CyaY superfamily)
VSKEEVDFYLAGLPEPKRSTLELLRERILQVIPEAEECISYGMPAFRVNGKVLAGFAAFKNHLAYLPHSGSVLGNLDLSNYEQTKGSLHFQIDDCLELELVEKLINLKRLDAGV